LNFLKLFQPGCYGAIQMIRHVLGWLLLHCRQMLHGGGRGSTKVLCAIFGHFKRNFITKSNTYVVTEKYEGVGYNITNSHIDKGEGLKSAKNLSRII